MKSFFSKYSFLIIWIVVIAVVGALFIFIVQPSLHLGGPVGSGTQIPAPPVSAPAAPATPTVSLTIVKTKAGNSLYVQWANLPANTTALQIFRGPTNSTSGWALWKTLSLDQGQLSNGNASISVGDASLSGYSFYVEAVGANGNASGTESGAGSNPGVLWTSPVTEPPVATSTPEGGPGSAPPDQGTPPPTATTSSPSSTTPAAPASPSSTIGQTTSTPPPSSPGAPYYNPQVQVQGYASGETNNFWVQYLNKDIEIGWQNLPPGTASAVISRAAAGDGPWTPIFTQQDPNVNSAYSIQLVDNTLGSPYYYELSAVNGSTTLAVYGPVYLSAFTQ